MEVKNLLHCGGSYVFVSTESDRLWIPSRMKENRFDQGNPPKNLGYRHKEKNLRKTIRQVTYFT